MKISIKDDYGYTCAMEGIKPTRRGLLAHYLWTYWYRLRYWLASRPCKIKGHDYVLHDTGGPENGPCIHGECRRCGYTTPSSYHG